MLWIAELLEQPGLARKVFFWVASIMATTLKIAQAVEIC
jgi:hypothetical protein